MFNAPLPEPKLLKTVLEPLLEDFQFWFGQTERLLEAESPSLLDPSTRLSLLERVRSTRQEVSAAQSLLQATDGQAGLEASVLVPWHQLVLECWQIGMQVRRDRADQSSSMTQRS